MIKHLLISIVTIFSVLPGCGDGLFGWKTCCEVPPGSYCISDECSAGPPEDEGCNGDGGGTIFYVWTTVDCGEQLNEICATDLADAQAKAEATYGTFPHGDVAADPDSTRPKMVRVCGSGENC